MRYAVNVPNFEDYSDVRTVAGVALATERLRLGPMVTPLARRRPWKVARETVTLDRLSGGRPASTAAPRSSSTTRASWSPWMPRTSAGCWRSSASSARARGRSTCWSAG
jgi:hypothetical protein